MRKIIYPFLFVFSFGFAQAQDQLVPLPKQPPFPDSVELSPPTPPVLIAPTQLRPAPVPPKKEEHEGYMNDPNDMHEGIYPCPKRDNCIEIISNPGGEVHRFLKVLNIYKKKRTEIRILGDCASSCTLYLNQEPDLICVADNAKLGFHRIQILDKLGSVEEQFKTTQIETYKIFTFYPKWLQQWIIDNDAMGSLEMTWLPHDVMVKYLRKCN